jgi:predicted nuclease with TOPRIM domain
MNTSYYTIPELIRYVLNHSSDPIAIRLAEYLSKGEDVTHELRESLIQAGMDTETNTFDYGVSPGTYIRNLEYDIEGLRHDLEESQREVERLSTMTMVEAMSQLIAKCSDIEYKNRMLHNRIEALDYEHEKVKDKLNMWTILNR